MLSVVLAIQNKQILKYLHSCVIIWNKRANVKITQIHYRRNFGNCNKLKQYVEIRQQNLLLPLQLMQQILRAFRAFAHKVSSGKCEMRFRVADCCLANCFYGLPFHFAKRCCGNVFNAAAATAENWFWLLHSLHVALNVRCNKLTICLICSSSNSSSCQVHGKQCEKYLKLSICGWHFI